MVSPMNLWIPVENRSLLLRGQSWRCCSKPADFLSRCTRLSEALIEEEPADLTSQLDRGGLEVLSMMRPRSPREDLIVLSNFLLVLSGWAHLIPTAKNNGDS